MKMLIDYRCSCGHVSEHYIERCTEDAPCLECGATAHRLISPVRCKLDHTFPGQASKWEKMHEREAKIDTSHRNW